MKKEKVMIISMIVLMILWLSFCLKHSIIPGMINTSGYSNLQIILFATIVIALPFIAIFIFLKGMDLIGEIIEIFVGGMKMELEPVKIYVPSENQIIVIEEGSGCNLDKEDFNNGIVDYINYEQYDKDTMENIDGGQIDIDDLVSKRFKTLTEAIPFVLEFIFDDENKEYEIVNE
jgi:hypothetical protein